MDCFYAAVEMRDNPGYRNRAIAVGGRPGGRGVISTCNYKAREYGVHSAMSVGYALRLCPDLLLVDHHFDKYKEASAIIRDIFYQFTDLVEPLSLDEAFLDVTDTRKYGRSATLMAKEIRKRIFQETQLTASAGIGPNKLLAKIASDWNKPNGQHVITPEEIGSFVKDLSLSKIFGVGKVTAKRLKDFGFVTCGELQTQSKYELAMLLGNSGEELYELCRGIDDRPVQTSGVRKSLSVENTFATDLKNVEECLEQIPKIYAEFCRRLKKMGEGYRIKNIMFKIKFSDFQTTTIERNIDDIAIDNYRELCQEAFIRQADPVRLLGLGVKFITAKEGDPKQLKLL